MKALLTGTLLLAMGLSARAVSKPELDGRLQKLTVKFEQMQANPATRVPPDVMRKAAGVILMQISRGGFIFGYQGGSGVLMVKEPPSGQWSAPVFLTSNVGTFGAQIGGQTSFTVVLIMNTNAIPLLTGGNYQFSGQLQGTAGDLSKSQENNASALQQMTLVFSDTQGLYGGAVVKAGGFTPDTKANMAYYGEYLSPQDILYGNRVKPTQASTFLADKISQYMK